jgi:hypothetical protein
MGRACSTHGGRLHVEFRWESQKERGRPRRRWEDNIKTDLRKIVCCGMDWIDLVQDRGRWRAFLNTVMN